MTRPLKLIPAYKDYVWGGEKLRTIYKKQSDFSTVAESWELSCHKDGYSLISGGDYDGKTLLEYIEKNPSSLGTSIKGNELPILIKLIDAADNLSVQVHPSDEQAKVMENQNGKTEMWYVINAEEGAKITYGVKDDITKEELECAIKDKKLENLLNCVPSKKGDVFFVEAGTIHAIGKGNLIAEIQQNSNVTYRLYDYGRKDKNGKERELHIDKGIMASNLKKMQTIQIPDIKDGSRVIGKCEYFVVTENKIQKEKLIVADGKTYYALVCIEGSFEIVSSDSGLTMEAGETVFIPSDAGKCSVIGSGTVLEVSYPV